MNRRIDAKRAVADDESLAALPVHRSGVLKAATGTNWQYECANDRDLIADTTDDRTGVVGRDL